MLTKTNQTLSLIEQKLRSIKDRLDLESRRIATFITEADSPDTVRFGSREAALFGASVGLSMSAELENIKSSARELELRLNGIKQRDITSRDEMERLSADTALVELKLKGLTTMLNAARLTIDGVTDIWGRELPSGGLWDK